MIQVLQNYLGTSMLGILACLGYYLLAKENRNYRKMLAYVLACLLLMNSATLYVAQRVGEGATFYRILWNIPTVVLAAYLVMMVYQKLQKREQKIIFVVLGICTLGIAANISAQKLSSFPETPYYVQQDAIDICEIIHEDAGEDAYVTAYLDDDLMYGVRQYDAHIKVVTTDDYKRFDQFLLWDNYNISGIVLRSAFANSGTQYISVPMDNLKAQMVCLSGGCSVIGNSENFVVFRTNLDSAKEIQGGKYIELENVENVEDVVIEGIDIYAEYLYDSSNRIISIQENGELEYLTDGSKEYQSVDFGDYLICSVNTSSGEVSGNVVEQFMEDDERGKPIILLLSKPIYLEAMKNDSLREQYLSKEDSAFVGLVTDDDSSVVAIFGGERVEDGKYYVNNHCYEFISVSSDEEGKTIIRVRSN